MEELKGILEKACIYSHMPKVPCEQRVGENGNKRACTALDPTTKECVIKRQIRLHHRAPAPNGADKVLRALDEIDIMREIIDAPEIVKIVNIFYVDTGGEYESYCANSN